ncbi:MAG: hypothetical protein IJ087_10635 [Eggerthellaceae bacterium]|nr:hypothetical protein [Eggerthellaceae bacterium]
MVKSRFLATFMSLVLAVGMCPLLAFAAPGDEKPSDSKLAVAVVDDDGDDDGLDDEFDDGFDDDEDWGEDEDEDEDGWDEGDEEGDWGDDEDGWGESEGDWGDDEELLYLDDAIVEGVSDWTYDGTSHIDAASIKVKLGGATLVEGEDYEVYFEDEAGEEIEAADIKDAGDYVAYIEGVGDYEDDFTDVEFTVKKAENPLKATAKGKTAVLKAKALKKKAATVSYVNISNAKGAVTCANVSKNKVAKKFAVNANKGSVKVAKKTKAGKYPVIVQVSAKGDGNYKPSAAQTVSFTVQVKK